MSAERRWAVLVGRHEAWLRQMYAGGRGNATAKRYARVWAPVLSWGLLPRRWVTLEVRGRTTGRTLRFPLGMADWRGDWYLVSMLGECNWVSNVRAAHGRVTLLRRGRHPVLLVEVPIDERAPVLRRYLDKVPGGRPHVRVEPGSLLTDFAVIAADHPVFRVVVLEPRAAFRPPAE